MGAIRRPPVVGPAVADPRHKTAVQMHRSPVLSLVCTRDCGVDRDDIGRRKIVPEGDLYCLILYSCDNTAKVPPSGLPAGLYPQSGVAGRDGCNSLRTG
jgi:hypothetical protein